MRGVGGALMSHSILAADTRCHLKTAATAVVLAVSLIVIAWHLHSRPSAPRGMAQASTHLLHFEARKRGIVR
jgi:hypothetical protein